MRTSTNILVTGFVALLVAWQAFHIGPLAERAFVRLGAEVELLVSR